MQESLGAQHHEIGRKLYLFAVSYQTLELYPEAKQFIGDAVKILRIASRQGHYLTKRAQRVSNALGVATQGD